MPMESMKLESAEVQVDAGDAGLMQNVHDRCPELVGRDQIDVPGDGQAYPTGCAGGLVQCQLRLRLAAHDTQGTGSGTVRARA